MINSKRLDDAELKLDDVKLKLDRINSKLDRISMSCECLATDVASISSVAALLGARETKSYFHIPECECETSIDRIVFVILLSLSFGVGYLVNHFI